MEHDDYMRIAIKEADQSIKSGNQPFAVVVVDDTGEIICKDHDRVKEQMDPTAHGEINAIRSLCSENQNLSLQNTTFYTTSEPCPTCLSAMIKAKVSRVYYGAETEATASLPIKAEYLANYAKKYPIKVVGGILEKETLGQREQFYEK